MVQAAHLDLHVGLSEKYPLNFHFWLHVVKHIFETTPELCVSIREVEQFRLLVCDFLKIIITIIIIIIIIIGSIVLCGPWLPQANVASDLYSGHPPANFYKPVPLRLFLPRQSILISVGHVLVDLHCLSTIYF